MSKPNKEPCSDNDSYVSQELRSPISTDEYDGSGHMVYDGYAMTYEHQMYDL